MIKPKYPATGVSNSPPPELVIPETVNSNNGE